MYSTKWKRLFNFDDIAYRLNPRNPFSVYRRQTRDRYLIEMLNKYNINISRAKVLDIGCSYGGTLLLFLELGAVAENLYGIDLMDYRIVRARLLNPGIHYSSGSAESLRYDDETFDIALTFLLFSSIFDRKLQRKIGEEVARVLKKGGYVIFYDNNLQSSSNNPDVRGIDKNSLKTLFPGCKSIELRSVESRYSFGSFQKILWTVNGILELLPFLKTRYLALFKKES